MSYSKVGNRFFKETVLVHTGPDSHLSACLNIVLLFLIGAIYDSLPVLGEYVCNCYYLSLESVQKCG